MNRIMLIWIFVFSFAAMYDDAGVHSVPDEVATIQEAIVKANEGDIVLVSPGTYRESIDFLGKEILVKSHRGPGKTIIDGSVNLDSSVVTFRSGETEESILDGFSIIGGTGNYGPTSTHCGGGIFIYNSSPTIQNNIIQENGLPEYYTMGGGIYIYAESQNTEPRIIKNIIRSNKAMKIGAGIFTQYAKSSIIHNIIQENIAKDFEIPIEQGIGGGITCLTSENLIFGNIIERNEAGNFVTWSQGGGIKLSRSNDIVTCNIIKNNYASMGGGMYIYNEEEYTSEIYNNLFIENEAMGDGEEGGRGGGIQLFQGNIVVRNNTICRNKAKDNWGDGLGGGISFYSGGSSLIENNIIAYQENGGGIYLSGSSHVLSYNDVHGNIGGDYLGCSVPHDTDISEPPCFVNLLVDDYRLLPTSLCIDAGNPEISDPDSTRSDIGTFYFDQSGPLILYITPDKKDYSNGEIAHLQFRLININEETQPYRAVIGVVTAREDTLVIAEKEDEIEPYRMDRISFSYRIPEQTPQGMYMFFGKAVNAKDEFMFSIF